MASEFSWVTKIQQCMEENIDVHIPPDITFKFEEDGVEYEIDAHKVFMGLVSPVFNKAFFVTDTKDKDAKEMFVKGTTCEAFMIMKNAIYGTTSMEDGLKGKSTPVVFAVLDLVTRYQIPELRQVVQDHLAIFPLTDDTVLEVASEAMRQAATFETEARNLLFLCASFLKLKLKSVEDVFKYMADHNDDKDIVHELLVLLNEKDSAIASAECPNCRQQPCQEGAEVRSNEFSVGLLVTTNDSPYWDDDEHDWGKGIVTKVYPAHVIVDSISGDNDEYKVDGCSSYCYMKKKDDANFNFCCE